MQHFLSIFKSVVACVALCATTSLADLVLQINTEAPNAIDSTFRLPLNDTVDVIIDWGDGQLDTISTPGNHQHFYTTPGTYQIRISGYLGHYGYTDVTQTTNYQFNRALIAITEWDISGLSSLRGACLGAANLESVPEHLPAGVTDISAMFWHAAQFNTDISAWQTGNVTSMQGLFYGNLKFNQPIGSWDVSGVVDMSSMFFFASSFNADISGWNTASVTTMASMFAEARAFNQPIGNWSVSSVTDMQALFYRAEQFNNNLVNWDVSNVTDMAKMFYAAESFNQNIGSWDVSKVTVMDSMFFKASAFNGGIENWNVQNVTSMGGMFFQAKAFNAAIDAWDVSSVVNMSNMFNGAESFNRNIGSWQVAACENMQKMFANVALFAPKYDSLLIGWASQQLSSNVIFDGGNSHYVASSAAVARQQIIDTFGWSISDAGAAPARALVGNVSITGDNSDSLQAHALLYSAGETAVFEHGVCVFASADLSDTVFCIERGALADTGYFSVLLPALSPLSTYFFQAWAGNDSGVGTSQLQAWTTPKRRPLISTWPVADTLMVADTLSQAQLSGGQADVEGAFAFARPDSIVDQSGMYEIVFTPQYTDSFYELTGQIALTVAQPTRIIDRPVPVATSLRTAIFPERNPVSLSASRQLEFIVAAPAAERVTVYILDAFGNQIDSFEGSVAFDSGVAKFSWDLTQQYARPVLPGTYLLVAKLSSAGKPLQKLHCKIAVVP